MKGLLSGKGSKKTQKKITEVMAKSKQVKRGSRDDSTTPSPPPAPNDPPGPSPKMDNSEDPDRTNASTIPLEGSLSSMSPIPVKIVCNDSAGSKIIKKIGMAPESNQDSPSNDAPAKAPDTTTNTPTTPTPTPSTSNTNKPWSTVVSPNTSLLIEPNNQSVQFSKQHREQEEMDCIDMAINQVKKDTKRSGVNVPEFTGINKIETTAPPSPPLPVEAAGPPVLPALTPRSLPTASTPIPIPTMTQIPTPVTPKPTPIPRQSIFDAPVKPPMTQTQQPLLSQTIDQHKEMMAMFKEEIDKMTNGMHNSLRRYTAEIRKEISDEVKTNMSTLTTNVTANNQHIVDLNGANESIKTQLHGLKTRTTTRFVEITDVIESIQTRQETLSGKVDTEIENINIQTNAIKNKVERDLETKIDNQQIEIDSIRDLQSQNQVVDPEQNTELMNMINTQKQEIANLRTLIQTPRNPAIPDQELSNKIQRIIDSQDNEYYQSTIELRHFPTDVPRGTEMFKSSKILGLLNCSHLISNVKKSSLRNDSLRLTFYTKPDMENAISEMLQQKMQMRRHGDNNSSGANVVWRRLYHPQLREKVTRAMQYGQQLKRATGSEHISSFDPVVIRGIVKLKINRNGRRSIIDVPPFDEENTTNNPPLSGGNSVPVIQRERAQIDQSQAAQQEQHMTVQQPPPPPPPYNDQTNDVDMRHRSPPPTYAAAARANDICGLCRQNITTNQAIIAEGCKTRSHLYHEGCIRTANEVQCSGCLLCRVETAQPAQVKCSSCSPKVMRQLQNNEKSQLVIARRCGHQHDKYCQETHRKTFQIESPTFENYAEFNDAIVPPCRLCYLREQRTFASPRQVPRHISRTVHRDDRGAYGGMIQTLG